MAGYNYSNQDASGLLGVVESGQRHRSCRFRPRSASICGSGSDACRVDGGTGFDQMRTGVYDVVYLVRGRNPSPQDGIWLATVRPADLP